MAKRLATLALALAAVACGSDEGQDSGGSPPVRAGLFGRPANPSCVAWPRETAAVSIDLAPAFRDLDAFSQPVAAVQIPGDDSRWFVLEREGFVRVFTNDPAVETFDDFVTLTDRVVRIGSEGGLLGIAFPDDFAASQEVYLSYTASPQFVGDISRLSRFTSSDGGGTVDPGSETVLISLGQPAGNHNGGHIAFGPDGFLYLGLGDGGGGNDPRRRAQDNRHLLGTMVRIDVEGAAVPYGIPQDNPFAGQALCNATGVAAIGSTCPEIYAYGLRNPWRWSFDRAGTALWLGDVGQGAWEEMNRIERGRNYGWPCREGAHDNPPRVCLPEPLTDPVVEYPNPGPAAVTGGFVYRGTSLPDLVGVPLFADFSSGRIFGIVADAQGAPQAQLLLDSSIRISSFAEGEDGELYVLDYDGGALHRIVAGPPVATPTTPLLLSETGCVDPADPVQRDAGLVSYAVNAPFWSDGASKTRWLGVPDGETIEVDLAGDLHLPPGSIALKDFRFGARLVETRLFVHHFDGIWAGYTYVWDSLGTDASLVRNGTVVDVSGQDWRVPSSAECLECHTAIAGRSLGLTTPQLDRDLLYTTTGVTANQLETLGYIDLIDLDAVDRDRPALVDPSDEAAPLEERARSYLDTNCSQCHRSGGPTLADIDLRHATALENTNACGVPPLRGDIGIPGALLLTPRNRDLSLIHERMDRRDVHGMPPLASLEVDTEGVDLVGDWIDALPGCP